MKIQTAGFLDYLNIALITSVLIAGGVLFFVLPHKTISEVEKRTLTPFPVFSEQVLLSGKYTQKIDEYFADNFPFRDHWIGVSGQLRNWRGFEIEQEVKIVATVNPEFIPQDQAELIADSTEKTTDTIKKASHSLFIYEGRAYQLFGSSAKVAGIYSSCLNTYFNAVKDSLICYNLVVPSPAEFQLPDKYLRRGKQEKINIGTIYNGLTEGVCTADAYSSIENHKGEYMFFGTDHHWTALGAYYAYTAFAECAKFTPLDLNSLEKRSKSNFLGSLYSLSLDADLKNHPDVLEYYKIPGNFKVQVNSTSNIDQWTRGSLLAEGASGGNSYSLFLGGDFPVQRIVSDNKNGRKILVLKESFGNAFVPFLAPHFEEIYVADIRYFKFGLLDFIAHYHINETLVINGVFMANNPYFPRKIKSMIYKSQGSLGSKKPESKDSTKK